MHERLENFVFLVEIFQFPLFECSLDTRLVLCQHLVYALLESFVVCLAEEVPVGEYTLPLSEAEVVKQGQYNSILLLYLMIKYAAQ